MHVGYSYLLKSELDLVRYLGCNLLGRGYRFYVTFWLPEDVDPVTVDAKLILTYSCHLSKSHHFRRRKAGVATVRYLRCGRLCLLLATRGRSPFFEREAFSDLRERALVVAGHSIRAWQDDDKRASVSVRLHREAIKALRREAESAAGAWTAREFEGWFWALGDRYLSFKGVQDDTFALLKYVNALRRERRRAPVEWKRCLRKRISVAGSVFLESPPELLELLRWEARRK